MTSCYTASIILCLRVTKIPRRVPMRQSMPPKSRAIALTEAKEPTRSNLPRVGMIEPSRTVPMRLLSMPLILTVLRKQKCMLGCWFEGKRHAVAMPVSHAGSPTGVPGRATCMSVSRPASCHATLSPGSLRPHQGSLQTSPSIGCCRPVVASTHACVVNHVIVRNQRPCTASLMVQRCVKDLACHVRPCKPLKPCCIFVA